jgi:Cu/Ag efflux protein CusF
MITKDTATQIMRRNEKLEKINLCFENISRLSSAALELTFSCSDTTEIFSIHGGRVIELLKEMKAYEETCLGELNTLAVQEAQG